MALLDQSQAVTQLDLRSGYCGQSSTGTSSEVLFQLLPTKQVRPIKKQTNSKNRKSTGESHLKSILGQWDSERTQPPCLEKQTHADFPFAFPPVSSEYQRAAHHFL